MTSLHSLERVSLILVMFIFYAMEKLQQCFQKCFVRVGVVLGFWVSIVDGHAIERYLEFPKTLTSLSVLKLKWNTLLIGRHAIKSEVSNYIPTRRSTFSFFCSNPKIPQSLTGRGATIS